MWARALYAGNAARGTPRGWAEQSARGSLDSEALGEHDIGALALPVRHPLAVPPLAVPRGSMAAQCPLPTSRQQLHHKVRKAQSCSAAAPACVAVQATAPAVWSALQKISEVPDLPVDSALRRVRAMIRP